MASLDPTKVGDDQDLGPEFIVSFTVSSFSIDRYSSQQSFNCNTYGDKNVLRLEKVRSQLGSKGPQTGTAYHAILIGLKSSNNLMWLNILIKISTNQFWWASRP